MSLINKIHIILYVGLLSTLIPIMANDVINKKTALFVVGPGRCGSSCMMGVLQILGIAIGDDFSEPYEGNAKGEFEHLAFRQLNYQITEDLVHTKILFYLPVIDWNTHPQKENYIQSIQKILSRTFGNFPQFALKSPRISFLLPLYVEAADRLGYIPKVIVMQREPEEIIKSFLKAYPENSPINFELISYYVTKSYMAILKNIQNIDYITISYTDLLNNTETTLEKLNGLLPDLDTFNNAQQKLQKFLDKDLQHFNVMNPQN